MGQILHKCAKTTFRVRKEIQESKESAPTLARKYGINVKTVYKWKRRNSIEDFPLGPKKTRTVLTPLEEVVICQFRQKTLFSLDDVFIALRESIPALTRSNLHRCLQRHGISKLPQEEKTKEKRGRFKRYEIGFFHLDISEIRLKEKKYSLYVAIDRVSKFSHARLYEKQNAHNAVIFLEELVELVPYKIHTVLTDNGIQFSDHAQTKVRYKHHVFDLACERHSIEHRLTKVQHPWTNGQVERMNRSIKEATIRLYHYENKEQVEQHLEEYLRAYNFGKRLKSIGFKTPYEYMWESWQKRPEIFLNEPNHKLMGLNIYVYSPIK